MKTGKISESILKRSVLKQCRGTHPAVLQGAESGSDCALILAAEKSAVSCSVHPAVLDTMKKVRFAIEHAVNNLACSGAEPAAVLLTLLLPEEAEEAQLKEIMREAETVCAESGVQIAGGHTEVSPAVKLPVLTVTALGMPDSGDAVLSQEPAGGVAHPKTATGDAVYSQEPAGSAAHSRMMTGDAVLPGTASGKKAAGCLLQAKNALPGMDLLVAGTAGREGTALIAWAHEEELKKRFPPDFVEEAKSLGESISILQAARIAKSCGAAALHDASQGGIFGTLWELCEGAKCGLTADLRKIPIRQETIEICEYFGYHPYCLLSGGALLIAASDGRRVEMELAQHGIMAAVIGKLTDSHDRILINGEERRFLDRPAQDEIWKERGMSWAD